MYVDILAKDGNHSKESVLFESLRATLQDFRDEYERKIYFSELNHDFVAKHAFMMVLTSLQNHFGVLLNDGSSRAGSSSEEGEVLRTQRVGSIPPTPNSQSLKTVQDKVGSAGPHSSCLECGKPFTQEYQFHNYCTLKCQAESDHKWIAEKNNKRLGR